LGCTVAPRSCRVLAHPPPFAHALVATLYVMVLLSTLPCTITQRSPSALAHLPPFSHALIAAL
jgi:hypothetical protein